MLDTGEDNRGLFMQLMRESVITQAMITMAVLIIIGGLLWQGRVVPSELYFSLAAVLGFYFGAKQGLGQARTLATHKESLQLLAAVTQDLKDVKSASIQPTTP